MTDETWLKRYGKNAELLPSADARFWFEVDSMLRRLEEERGLSSDARQRLDEIIDGDSCAAPEDMTPLEYLEGVMGELGEEVDL